MFCLFKNAEKFSSKISLLCYSSRVQWITKFFLANNKHEHLFGTYNTLCTILGHIVSC